MLVFYLADRTNFFFKTQKQYDGIAFFALVIAMIIAGLFTLEQKNDSSFLNRHLTDEWKGWMQIVILIYHYSGASRISGIYNRKCIPLMLLNPFFL